MPATNHTAAGALTRLIGTVATVSGSTVELVPSCFGEEGGERAHGVAHVSVFEGGIHEVLSLRPPNSDMIPMPF